MAIRGSDKIRHKRTLTNSQTLRHFGDRMPAIRNLLDCVQLEVFNEIAFSHNCLLASF